MALGIGRFYVAKAMSLLALSLDRPAEIERDLGPFAAGLGATVGFSVPAYFYGDLIDARLMTGDLDGAGASINGLIEAGRSVDSPLALVIGLRGKALLESPHGRHDAALEAVTEAEAVSVTLAIPLGAGRTMLAKGLILRRTRRKHGGGRGAGGGPCDLRSGRDAPLGRQGRCRAGEGRAAAAPGDRN